MREIRIAIRSTPDQGAMLLHRVGVTGHTNLTDATVSLVAGAIDHALRREWAGRLANVVGVTCLARGADQIFARSVLDLGGTLEVVLPAADYRERKIKPGNAAAFDALISDAAEVVTMPFDESNRNAYAAASEHMLDTVEHVLAVWDGQPADGTGGTADVVGAARERDLGLTVLWPEGAARA